MNISPATGVEDQTPMPERMEVQAVSQEHDQRRQIQMFAQVVANNLAQVAAVFEIMTEAAKIEPDFERIIQKLNKQRLEHMTVAVQDIATNGPFRDNMDETRARDTVWTLTSGEVFLLLTQDRGWSKEKYAQWLADTLISVLLP
jgi:hypothetical protein